jgi:4-amino-4-deoxy-L-arabinose transferase-like glycosyltransferase
MNITVGKTVARLSGFILSVLFIFLGLLWMRSHGLLPGGILLVFSIGLFLFSVKAIEKNPPGDNELALLKPYFFPALLFIGAVALTGMVIVNVTDNSRSTGLDHLASAEWLMSILCLSAAVLWAVRWKPPRPSTIRDWVKANPVEIGLVSVIIVASLAIRMVYLTQHPYPWSGDEASIGLEARRLLSGENTNWFSTGWSGQPNVSFLPTAFSMLIFGQTIFAIKMTSVIGGTLAVLAVYLLGREWFGKEIGIIAAGFLAAYPFHLQFSRIGVDNVIDSLMASLVIWLIFRTVRTKSLPAYLMAGIASGLTFYTYVGTRLVLAMGIGSFVYIIIRRHGYWKDSRARLATFLAGLLVTLTPIATFFIMKPALFMTRISQEGIFFNGWLPNQIKTTGQGLWQVLFSQFTNTILVFFSQNATYFLNFDRPYLTILGAIFFVIGLAVAFRHLFEPRYFVMQAWFWSVLALGGFITVNPPANTRLVMTIPVTALFIALGIWQVAGVMLSLKIRLSWVYSMGIALVLILAFQNLDYYFGTYWQNHSSQDANSELAMEVGQQLQRLGDRYDYYLFGLPRVFANFPTTEFLAPGVPKYDLNAASITSFNLNPGRGAFIVAIPENEALLQQLMTQHPGGKWETVQRKVKDEALYYAYVLLPNQANSP